MKICLFYENIEIFIEVHQTVQHLLGKITVNRPSLENWLKSDICLISLISLKSGDFIILVHQTV